MREERWKVTAILKAFTFRRFEPLLLDAVADLSLGLTLGEMTLDHRCVPFINLDLLLVIRFKVSQLYTHTQAKFYTFTEINTNTDKHEAECADETAVQTKRLKCRRMALFR